MPITFRHDAAAVVLPSTNEAGTKYGQSLVLQQQQQKYAAQQAGYDRMFTLGRDQQQQMQQAMRQGQQNAANTIRDVNQQVFQQQRDKMLFDQQQQQQEAERQRAFMDEARKQSSGFIMESIKNGEYDPATARKLQQNLVAESEALGNPQLDATQRAEVLNKIRAERAMLSANRMEPPPKPTAQDQFNQSIVTDPETGQRYRQNAKGDYEPIQQQPTRPTSADEAFMADPKLRDKYMVEAKEMVTERDEFGKPKPLDEATRKEAAELAKKLYEEDNNLGTPTPAPALPATGAAPAIAPESQSILEPAAAPSQPTPVAPAAVPADDQENMWNAKMQALDKPPTPEQYKAIVLEVTGRPFQGELTEYDAKREWERARKTAAASAVSAPPTPAAAPANPPASAGNPWEEVASGGQAEQSAPSPAPASPEAKPPMPLTSNASSQNTPAANPWAEVASGQPTAPAPQSPVAPAPAPQAAQQAPANTVPPAAPDFGAMAASAKSAKDKGYINQMAKVYEGQTPEVQSAISVFVNPSSTDAEFIAARDYLKAAGINLEQMANAPSKKQEPGAELRSPPRGPKY